MSTIAYLSDKDGEEIHQFTLGEGVDIELIQDTTEPEEFCPEKEYPEKHASVRIPATAMEYEYVGTKVQFFTEKEVTVNGQNALQFQPMSYKEFSQKYGKIYSDDSKTPLVENDVSKTKTDLRSGTRNGWMEYGNSSESDKGTIYLYYGLQNNGTTGTKLANVKHGSRLWIFDSIIVNQDCNEKYVTGLAPGETIKLYNQNGTLYKEKSFSSDQLKGFRIVVTAYAIQGNIDATAAESSLVSLINNN